MKVTAERKQQILDSMNGDTVTEVIIVGIEDEKKDRVNITAYMEGSPNQLAEVLVEALETLRRNNEEKAVAKALLPLLKELRKNFNGKTPKKIHPLNLVGQMRKWFAN